MAEADLVHNDLTRLIIGAAMEVHNELGAGFLESVYEEAMAIELDLRNVSHERQKSIPVFYKGKQAKVFFCDLLIDGSVLVELKAVKETTVADEAQVLNYLKATDLHVGLLINFGKTQLFYKRFVMGQPRSSAVACDS